MSCTELRAQAADYPELYLYTRDRFSMSRTDLRASGASRSLSRGAETRRPLWRGMDGEAPVINYCFLGTSLSTKSIASATIASVGLKEPPFGQSAAPVTNTFSEPLTQ